MRWAICTAALGAVVLAGTAFAGVPTPVTVEVHTVLTDGFGTFTASGGGLCAGGTTSDVVGVTGFQSGRHLNFHVVKTFTCADGSGTFTMAMQAHYFLGTPTDSASWLITSGTGAYADLKGEGSLVGDEGAGVVDDHLVGTVH